MTRRATDDLEIVAALRGPMAASPSPPPQQQTVDLMRLLGDASETTPKASPGSKFAYGGEIIELPPELAGDAAEADRFRLRPPAGALAGPGARLIRYEAGRQRAPGAVSSSRRPPGARVAPAVLPERDRGGAERPQSPRQRRVASVARRNRHGNHPALIAPRGDIAS